MINIYDLNFFICIHYLNMVANLIFSLILSNENTLYILFLLFISCENDLNNYTACDFPQQLSCCGGQNFQSYHLTG